MIVAVVGVGVIGGSVGLAARRRLGATVRGVDPHAGAALEAGAIDEAHDDLGAALDGADAAVVAVPLGALPETVAAVLAQAPPGCLVTDVGSTKRGVVAANGDERFVGGHPLAGSEAAGVAHAREDLFDGAVWYLTPTSTTSGIALERLHRLVSGLGAQPAAIDADTHDRMMAAVSHLPHVVANVLVAQAARALGGERLPPTGRASATRPASPAPTPPSGPTSISPTATRSCTRSTAPSRASARPAPRSRRATARPSRPGSPRPRASARRCSRPASSAARCASCGPSSRTAPASSPTSP